MPIAPRLRFYPAYGWEILRKAWGYLAFYRQCMAIQKEVLRAPDRWSYTDLAITPPAADEFDTLDLYHVTSGGEEAVARSRRTSSPPPRSDLAATAGVTASAEAVSTLA